jgi:predicted dinucleotide-binding enzyme
MSYAILGAGKVGQALAKALAPKGIVPPLLGLLR